MEATNLVYENDTGLQVRELLALGSVSLTPGHYYEVEWLDKNGNKSIVDVNFQDGTIPEVGVNGVTSEALVAIIIHRTETLNGRFPSDDNDLAILHLKKALDAFNARTAKRKARGVEGQHVK